MTTSTVRHVEVVCLALLAVWLQGCHKSDSDVHMVYEGTRISNKEWKDKRDFVVFVVPGRGCCTGTVAGNVVLTAKHCVRGKSLSMITVKTAYGEHKVTRWEKHESWDVVLLWLDSDASTKNVMYLSSRKLEVDDAVAIAGFGLTGTGGCGKLYDSGMSDIKIKQTIWMRSRPHLALAGSSHNSRVGSCAGDSGGPWFRAENVDKGPFYVVGVNNWGTAQCGALRKDTVLTKTTALQAWIESHTSQFKFNDEVSAPVSSPDPTPSPTSSGAPPEPITVAPTSSPTSSGAPITCTDTSENKEWCGYWKENGYCLEKYQEYMQAYCANTCGTCSTLKKFAFDGSIEIPPSPATNAAPSLCVKTMFLGVSMWATVFARRWLH